MKNGFINILAMLAVAFAAIFTAGCSKDEPAGGSKEFTLHYFSFTDVSTGKGFEIPAPSYNGPAPSEFRITAISHEKGYDGDNFAIDPETGAITYTPAVTEDGEYRISVACTAGGQEYTFNEAVTVKFLLEFPGSLVFTPEEFVIDADVIMNGTPNDLSNKITVKAEDGAVSIKSFRLANVTKEGEDAAKDEYKSYFSINADNGTLSIVKGKEVRTGTYHIAYAINTEDNNEQIAKETAKVKVIAKPKELTYKGTENGIAEVEQKIGVTFEPEFEFSTGNLEFSMTLSPANEQITIDKATGAVTVADNHSLSIGDEFKATVTVKNDAAPEGVEFKDVLTLRIIELIVPVTEFSYDTKEIVYIQAFTATPEQTVGENNGRAAEYAVEDWGDLEKYREYVSFDANTGTFSAKKMNRIPVKPEGYAVTVKAWNRGNDKPTAPEEYKGGVTSTFTLKVAENINYFTYFSYGNNMDLSEDETNGVSQFRYLNRGDMDKEGETGKEILSSDMNEAASVTWTVRIANQMKTATIDENTGKLTYPNTDAGGAAKGSSWGNNQIGLVVVTATAGAENPETSVSVSMPVFFQCVQRQEIKNLPAGSAEREFVFVEYTPFVLRANPNVGGELQLAGIHYAKDAAVKTKTQAMSADRIALLQIDMRRNIVYQNVAGVYPDGKMHESGAPAKGNFAGALWDNYGADYGAKMPVSYFGDKAEKDEATLAKTLVYPDNSDNFTVKANKGVWEIADKGIASGVLLGQTVVGYNGNVMAGNDSNTHCAGVNTAYAVWIDPYFGQAE